MEIVDKPRTACCVCRGQFSADDRIIPRLVASCAAGRDCPSPILRSRGTSGGPTRIRKPDKFPLTTAPAGAPNVLVVLIDDVGYGAWSTFGGQIATPNLDRLANMGCATRGFHTTALCSPTRARAADRTQPPFCGHGCRHGDGNGVSRLHRPDSKSAAAVSEILSAEWLQHCLDRQEP